MGQTLSCARLMEAIEVTSSNRWRRAYPRPLHAVHHRVPADPETVELLMPARKQITKRSLELQKKFARAKGFPGIAPEAGHAVVWEMLQRGYKWTDALVAGHLVACGGEFNFQGCHRIAAWAGLHVRTVQRSRKKLEKDGWISSWLLLPGESVPGMIFPVRRVQVVRDVGALRRLAGGRHYRGYTGRKGNKPRRNSSARPSVADMPSVAGAHTKQSPTPAEFFDNLAKQHPDFATVLASIAANKRNGTQGPERAKPVKDVVPPAMPSDEIDAIERELLQQTVAQSARVPDKPPPQG